MQLQAPPQRSYGVMMIALYNAVDASTVRQWP